MRIVGKASTHAVGPSKNILSRSSHRFLLQLIRSECGIPMVLYWWLHHAPTER